MKARKFPWRKIRNAALFAALGYVISITNLVLPAALAAWAWFETDERDL